MSRNLFYTYGPSVGFAMCALESGQADRRTGGQAVIGGIDGGECDPTILPKVVWPSDVDRFKEQIDPLARATDVSIRQCAGLSLDDKREWGRFFASWEAFARRKTPTFGSANEWDHACASSRTIDAWRAKLKTSTCLVTGPSEVKGTESEKVFDAVRFATTGAVVIASIVTLIVYAPEIKGALSGLTKRGK